MNSIALKLPMNWSKILDSNKTNKYLKEISGFVENEIKKNKTIYPQSDLIFNSFEKTSFDKLKVVILGQDPYHNEGQAHGLSFSVPMGIQPPPSLKNIYKELHQDLEVEIPSHGNLEAWTNEGILLLNCFLTVNKNEPSSHKASGWEKLTDHIIEQISRGKENIVFLLWGKFAQSKASLIDANKHCLLKAAHPSPFSAYRGFFGCKHFSKTNDYLLKHEKQAINWTI